MNWPDAARLYRTLRPLRWSQFAYRARYACRRKLPGLNRRRLRSATVSLAQLADLKAVNERVGRELLEPVLPVDSRVLADGRLTLLNETHSVEGWGLEDSAQNRLWKVTLHYHEWLHALAEMAVAGDVQARELFFEYLNDWLARCQPPAPGVMALAWNAYATATRIAWWSKTLLLGYKELFQQRQDVLESMLSSLWRQARFLSANVEWDLRGNHLVRDALGLAWAGSLFRGEEPAAWLRQAGRIARSQANEQVLPDGAHFERSPSYHAEVRRDFLELTRLLPPGDADPVRNAVARMEDFAVWTRHPDGSLLHLNDGASASRHVVDGPLPTGGCCFPDAGLVAWHDPHWSVFFDAGTVGPDCQPGHAHADALTVNCSWGGRRLFVDPGCLRYDNDESRRYDRSTAAHNTVCVDGQDSSEMWHIFRVGRRARIRDFTVDFAADGFVCQAAHDGYRFLSGAPVHARRVELARGALAILDKLSGAGSHRVEGGLLVSPEWAIDRHQSGWRLRSGDLALDVFCESDASLHLAATRRPWRPDYGVDLTATRISWSYEGSLPVEVQVRVVPGGDDR